MAQTVQFLGRDGERYVLAHAAVDPDGGAPLELVDEPEVRPILTDALADPGLRLQLVHLVRHVGGPAAFGEHPTHHPYLGALVIEETERPGGAFAGGRVKTVDVTKERTGMHCAPGF